MQENIPEGVARADAEAECAGDIEPETLPELAGDGCNHGGWVRACDDEDDGGGTEARGGGEGVVGRMRRGRLKGKHTQIPRGEDALVPVQAATNSDAPVCARCGASD